ncbi:hypothetical protein ILYODFUR_003480 [Ilyodon furcidens]|uniref:Uncharacterized protein n=1 Tax=Ilyodon furcidens TaxID=33524 RepID=A0ABV0TVC2_9TELE
MKFSYIKKSGPPSQRNESLIKSDKITELLMLKMVLHDVESWDVLIFPCDWFNSHGSFHFSKNTNYFTAGRGVLMKLPGSRKKYNSKIELKQFIKSLKKKSPVGI